MNKEQTTTIRTLLTVTYSDILTEARRGQKGLRMAYLFSIQFIGENTGSTVQACAEVCGKTRGTIYTRFKRVIVAGYMYKQDKRYYLTDSGLKVYNTICREFDASMEEIVKVLTEEARKRL